MKLPRIAKDTSTIGPSHDYLNPGPEKSSYDVCRHEEMRLRNFRYGFHRVITDAMPDTLCSECGESIFSNCLIIDGVPFHGECFKSR
jgi:hypothetical protein